MRARACLSIAIVSLLAAEAASAAPPDEMAKDQFRQGREAFKQGDYKAALPLFRKSQELSPQVGTLLNLASCEEKLGMVASARHHFQEAVSQLPERDDRVSFAQERIAALEPRVARLRIKLGPTAEAGARVKLDDALVSPETIDADLPVDPGKHVIVASAWSVPDSRYEVTLHEGESASVIVEPGARGRPPDRRPAPSWSTQRIAGFVVSGVGVASIGAGAVMGAVALSTKSELEKLCPVPMSCTPAGVDKAHLGKALSVASTVGFIAGVAAAGAGVVLVLTSASGAAKPAATVSVSALPGGGAVGLEGRF